MHPNGGSALTCNTWGAKDICNGLVELIPFYLRCRINTNDCMITKGNPLLHYLQSLEGNRDRETHTDIQSVH